MNNILIYMSILYVVPTFNVGTVKKWGDKNWDFPVAYIDKRTIQ